MISEDHDGEADGGWWMKMMDDGWRSMDADAAEGLIVEW